MALSPSNLQFAMQNVVVQMLIYKIKKRLSRKKRRWWIRGWIGRKHLGATHLISELADEDADSYINYFRMSEDNFNFLLSKVSHKISKQDTTCREALTAKLKLQITLRFLATGNSLTSLSYEFRVPTCTISQFLPDVLDEIYEQLKHLIKVRKHFLLINNQGIMICILIIIKI